MSLKTLRSSAGFTYIAALVMVVVLGIMASRAAVVWKTRVQREKEAELLFRGMQYMDGLRRWYWPKGVPYAAAAGASGNQAPQGDAVKYLRGPEALPNGVPGPTELKDLLKGNQTGTKPCLRKLYLDPITGKEFAPLKGADQRIIGVRSTSEAEPIKQGDFPFELDPADFEGKKKYKEWEFICVHWSRPLRTGQPKIPGASNPNERP